MTHPDKASPNRERPFGMSMRVILSGEDQRLWVLRM